MESQLRADIEAKHPEVLSSLREFEQSQLGREVIAYEQRMSRGGGISRGGKSARERAQREMRLEAQRLERIRQAKLQEARRLQELREKEEERKELERQRKEAEAERKETIVSAYERKFGLKSEDRWKDVSFTQKVKETIKETPEILREAGREAFVEGRPLSALTIAFSPLQKFAPDKKAGEIKTKVEWRGTEISPEVTPAPYKEETEFERLEREASLIPSLRQPAEITAGEIVRTKAGELRPEFEKLVTKDTTPEQLERVNIQFQEAVEKASEKPIERAVEKKAYFLERVEKAREPIYDIPRIVTTGALIGVSVSPVGSALLSTALTTEGFEKTVTGETKTEKALGVGMVALGLTGMGITTQRIARQVDVLKWQQLAEKRAKITGQELIRGEKGSLYAIKGAKRLGREAEVITKMKMPVFPKGADEFAVTGGRGVTRLRFWSFEKQKWITGKETFEFGGTGYLSPTAPRLTTKDLVIDLKSLKGIYGRGYYFPRGEREMDIFGFGGAVRRDKEFLRLMGGELGKGRYYPATDKRTVTSLIQEAGKIRLKDVSADTLKIWTRETGRRVSSEQFLEQLYAGVGSAPAFTEKAVQSAIKQSSATLSQVPSLAVSGAGAISVTEQKIKTKPVITQKERIAQLTIPETRQLLKTAPSLKTKTSAYSITGQPSRIKEALKESQVVRQITRQKLRTKLKTGQLQKLGFQMKPKVPVIPYDIPTIPIIPPVPFPLPKRRIQKKKKRRAGVLRKKDLTISEGFLTKALQLGRIEKLTRKQAKLRARRGIAPLSLRGIPIIIPDVPKRKKKRKKK